MARAFRPGPDGSVSIKLDSRERLVLRQLLVELQVRLGTRAAAGGPSGALRAPASTDFPIDEAERLLAGLGTDQVPPALPRDPVLARLLPDAYSPDLDAGQAAAEFRRFTEPELRQAKSAGAQALLDALADDRTSKISIAAEQVQTWLYALNDLRLSLGIQLEIDESDRRPRPGDPSYARGVAYDWLSWLQETLLAAAR